MKKFTIKHNDSIVKVAEFVLNIAKKEKKQFIYLNGELGSGKTELTKQIAKLLGIKEPITSPTFNYLKIYDPLVHIDAYHLQNNLDEFEDYFEDKLVIIEWAELLDLPYQDKIVVQLHINDKNEHIFSITY